MFLMGVALRRRYQQFLDFEPNSVLALTSNSFRCKQSQQATLRGLFSIHATLENGLELARKWRDRDFAHLPDGPGTSPIWREIPQDSAFLPSLDEEWYKKTAYARNHPSPLNVDIRNDSAISQLPGIERLCTLIKSRYLLQCDATIDLWTQIECELYLDRTKTTLHFVDHFADWILQEVAREPNSGETINLYELFEEVMFLAYLRRIDSNVHYLIASPIVESLIESQAVALGQLKPSEGERAAKYLGKKLVLGSSHDLIISILLHNLGLLPIEAATWQHRLLEAKRARLSDVELYRQGLKMPHFGLSVRFELVELRNELANVSLPLVRLAIYSEPDPSAGQIEWTPAPLGQVCKRTFREIYGERDQDLRFFYPKGLQLNEQFECPFELFKNVSARMRMDQSKYTQIINDQL